MRIDRVYIDGFKNLRDVEVKFDPDCLTTVVIGQNGAGKSTLIKVLTGYVKRDKGDIMFDGSPFEARSQQ